MAFWSCFSVATQPVVVLPAPELTGNMFVAEKSAHYGNSPPPFSICCQGPSASRCSANDLVLG